MKIPKFNAEKLSNADDLDEIEFYNFRWQQKLFNSKEAEYFGNVENCRTDTEKGYNRQLNIEITDSNGQAIPRRIFSYVNDDKFTEIRENRNSLIENVESNKEWDLTMDGKVF